MRWSRIALATIDKVSEWTGKLVSLFIPLMVVIIGFEVVARYIFNRPTIWAHELTMMFFTALVMLSGASVLRHGAHVNMDLVYSRLSPRAKGVLDMVSSILFFLFCGVLFWEGTKMALRSLSLGEHSGTFWNPPVYLIRCVIPVGALLIILQGLAKFVRDTFTVVVGGGQNR
jgi:TRAP-type mannitol/chloroaromatic compound transport system permease small subunit